MEQQNVESQTLQDNSGEETITPTENDNSEQNIIIESNNIVQQQNHSNNEE